MVSGASAGPLRQFWTHNQPGLRFSDSEPGSRQFFAQVEAHRYALEPAIEELVGFARWRGSDVLEAGCGIGTDGLQFARAGARYTGLDFSPAAVELARGRFEDEAQAGEFVVGSVTDLPFPDRSFDLVYSHGVIHHVPDMQRSVDELRRVLRPGGTAIVMVYHRGSLNYCFNIMMLRRALIGLLFLPKGVDAVSRLTGEDRAVLRGHRELFREHGLRYLRDRALFLSNNTDGPGNPLSRVLTRAQAARMFHAYEAVETRVRFLNLRIYPAGERIAGTGFSRRLERRYGWHLWLEGRAP